MLTVYVLYMGECQLQYYCKATIREYELLALINTEFVTKGAFLGDDEASLIQGIGPISGVAFMGQWLHRNCQETITKSQETVTKSWYPT